MAIEKKSLIAKRQTAKKALVAKKVSSDTPKASQVKAPQKFVGGHMDAPFRLHGNISTFRPKVGR
jgi:hypothetical protein